jgi:hypothetical protein
LAQPFRQVSGDAAHHASGDSAPSTKSLALAQIASCNLDVAVIGPGC